MTDTCGTCKFWRPSVDGSDIGECRRLAPTTITIGWDREEFDGDQNRRRSVWPDTLTGDWCGDYGMPPPAGVQ